MDNRPKQIQIHAVLQVPGYVWTWPASAVPIQQPMSTVAHDTDKPYNLSAENSLSILPCNSSCTINCNTGQLQTLKIAVIKQQLCRTIIR